MKAAWLMGTIPNTELASTTLREVLMFLLTFIVTLIVSCRQQMNYFLKGPVLSSRRRDELPTTVSSRTAMNDRPAQAAARRVSV
jgi:hypothetical protein